ncbi:hypothetical protein [Nonomuraea sp. NPDC046570]
MDDGGNLAVHDDADGRADLAALGDVALELLPHLGSQVPCTAIS